MVKSWVFVLFMIGSLAAMALFIAPVMAESARVLDGVHVLPVDTIVPEATIPPRPISVKLEGFVTSTYEELPGELSVDGTTVSVIDVTAITPAGLIPQIGDYVVINAMFDGSIFLASRIRIGVEVVNPIEFRGIITRLPERLNNDDPCEEWIIAGRSVEVDSKATIIVGTTPKVDYYAHVQGFLLPDDQIRATLIEVTDPAEAAAEFEFKGAIEEIASSKPGVWTIGGLQGLVDEDTEIKGNPIVGAMADVRGRRLGDDLLAFELIRMESEQRNVRIEGLIEEVEINYTAGSLEGYLIIDGTRIEIDERALLDESRGRAAPGMWAEVIASPFGPDLLYALRIRVERPD